MLLTLKKLPRNVYFKRLFYLNSNLFLRKDHIKRALTNRRTGSIDRIKSVRTMLAIVWTGIWTKIPIP